jgi:hypothetical protein
MRRPLTLLLLALPAQAAADPPPLIADLTYAGYTAHFRAISLHSEVLLAPSGYRITLSGHTSGMVGFIYRARWQTWADGTWDHSGVAPLHFAMSRWSSSTATRSCARWNRPTMASTSRCHPR